MAASSAYPLYPVDGIMGRVCSRCKTWQPVASFFKAKKEKTGIMNECKTCHKVHHDPATKSAYDKSRYQDTRTDRIASARRWYNEHKDEAKAYNVAYRAQNLPKIHQQAVSKYQANKDSVIAKVTTWRKANPDKRKAQEHRRRAQKYQAGGRYTVKEWQALKVLYDHRCLMCHRQEPNVLLTFDHIVPLSRGGHNDIANAQPLCFSCNSIKGTQVLDLRPS